MQETPLVLFLLERTQKIQYLIDKYEYKETNVNIVDPYKFPVINHGSNVFSKVYFWNHPSNYYY